MDTVHISGNEILFGDKVVGEWRRTSAPIGSKRSVVATVRKANLHDLHFGASSVAEAVKLVRGYIARSIKSGDWK